MIHREWFMSRNIRIMCWNIDRERRKCGPDVAGGFADLYRTGGRWRFPSQWNRPRLELNPRKTTEHTGPTTDATSLANTRRVERGDWTATVKIIHLWEEAKSLEFRQDEAARRHRIFMMLDLIRALLACVFLYIYNALCHPYYNIWDIILFKIENGIYRNIHII